MTFNQILVYRENFANKDHVLQRILVDTIFNYGFSQIPFIQRYTFEYKYFVLTALYSL